MDKRHGSEHLAKAIRLRSEVLGVGRRGLTHSRDDHYRVTPNPTGESAGRWCASLKRDSPMRSVAV